jgi:hypothetical protein
MDSNARRALAIIRSCVGSDRFALTVHFQERMQERGLFWPDVRAVIDDPLDIHSQGLDKYRRSKWIISGHAVGAGAISIVCGIELDRSQTEFLTLYGED